MRWGIQVCFLGELGDQTSRAKFQNQRPPRDANYVMVLSLLEMHSGGNVQWPWCRPSLPGVLGASDLILIYYWGGLRSVAPTGGSPCFAVLQHLRAANTLVHVQLNDWAGNKVTHPKRVHLGVREFGTNLEGGDLVRQTKQETSNILY